MKSAALRPEVAEKFDLLAGHRAGEYHFNGHKVDMTTISLEQATELVANKFPYLVEKPVKVKKSHENL